MFLSRKLPLSAAAMALALAVSPSWAAGRSADAEGDKAVALLQELIRFDTTNAPGDTTKVAAYLEGLFKPYGVQTDIIVAPNGKAAHFIARLKGDGTLPPLLLAAHTDVVPAQRDSWTVDPFAAIIKDGFLYGRGALDNKGSVAIYARALLRLLEDKVKLKRDIIFLAEADEEQGQYTTSWLVQNHWDKIDAAVALNEGGGILTAPDGSVRQVNVSIADKQTLNLKLTAHGPAAHSSFPLPPMTTANGQLIAALDKIAFTETPIRLLPQTVAYLKGLARIYPGPLAGAVDRLVAAQDDAARLVAAKEVMAAHPQEAVTLSALMRDTMVVTMINAGVKPNIIPGEAEAIVNARLMPGADVYEFVDQVKRLIDNPAIGVEIVNARPKEEQAAFFRERSAIQPSSTETDLFAALDKQARRVWPKAEVLPMMLQASTDAGAWRAHGIPVYGIWPYPVDPDTFSRVHGNDERVAVASIRQGLDYIYGVLRQVAAR
ncbi:M20/M25/M40 family metallo-hydrolase [Nitrospirillum amazonense]|uniref:M20/M25/M40 family metallo-hydrolase n=1 Tax=Nitrospirillum amazonense TaxID=28077 RepID=UPI002DD425D1|nr:M20/M25/M40 family metallo-hydrolase [Nitrospirillum amazonense]MEC4589670.1 M20/M25/M40 family metallo-hydrolase [Nitrospirillum amazonense]